MTEIIKIHNQEKLAKQLGSFRNWKISRELIDELARFLEDLSLGKVNRGKRLSLSAQVKYVYTLKVPLEFFGKATKKLSISDIDKFEKALSSDQIKSGQKGRPYSHSSKIAIRKALKVFLRWSLGTAKAVELAGWLDTREKKRTPDYLKEEQVEKLLQSCRTAEQRYVVAMLFDSGARVEEFVNIRYDDITFPEKSDNFVKVTLRDEFSKTQGRTISLYWRHSLDAIKTYVGERVAQGIKSQDPVFANTYDAIRMFLKRLGSSVLNRLVHPHLFRHSSATHYASRLNRQELCYRYGWNFSSNMPDVYISRAGMESKQLDEKFTQTEMGVLKDTIARMEFDSKLKNERIEQLRKQLDVLRQNVPAIARILERNPSVERIEANLKRRSDTP